MRRLALLFVVTLTLSVLLSVPWGVAQEQGPLTVAALLPSAGGGELETVHSIQPAESVLPDFGAMAGLAPLTDQVMEASGLRTVTYAVKSSSAVTNFVKTAEADGFIATRSKGKKQEIIQLAHPLMAHGFTLIYATDLKLVSAVYPADASLGDAEAMAAFWYANKPYSFYDSSFEWIARSALKTAAGKITAEMIASIESLSLQNRDVADFRDLAMFTGLKTLTLESVGIGDIAALAGMRNLEELKLINVPISSIKPLEGLNLREIEISDTKVRDLKPLMKMAGLTSLRVDRSKVEALPDLSGTSLRFLYLNGNSISDVASLAKLPALSKLELRDRKSVV